MNDECTLLGQIIAETKLQKATAEAQRACHNLEDMTDQFEQKKISDLKKILKEFVQVFKYCTLFFDICSIYGLHSNLISV